MEVEDKLGSGADSVDRRAFPCLEGCCRANDQATGLVDSFTSQYS